MSFPQTRMRRLRATESLRSLLRETDLKPQNLVLPLFVSEQAKAPESIEAMPGVQRISVDGALAEARLAQQLGIGALLLFGIPGVKDAKGSGAADPQGAVQRALGLIAAELPDLVLISDVCLCEYTDHGHCGLLDGTGQVDNDATIGVLADVAISHAQAGAGIVAPSDMMDGRVGHLRTALDAAGHKDTAILAYSSKFASAFYGPFRAAAGCTPAFGDRRSYQLDPANGREALRESLLDAEEGADMLMVKPALAYGDVISSLAAATRLPLAAYNVSGEYAMVKAAAAAGHIDERAVVLEILTSLRRAGAQLLITYHAKDAAQWLKE